MRKGSRAVVASIVALANMVRLRATKAPTATIRSVVRLRMD